MGLSLAGWFAGNGRADDWPHWRGPNYNGISQEKGWLDHWPEEGPPILWRANVGIGFSSFAVVKGLAYTMGHLEDQDVVFCFDAKTGKEVWKYSYASDLGDKYFEGGTTGTPTISGDRVFTLSRWGEVFCFNAIDGKVIWNRNVQKNTGAPIPGWGFAGSPVVLDSLLLLNVGDAGMALDKESGEILWQSANKEAGYSTPVPWLRNGSWSILLGSAQSYLSVEARNGKEEWRFRWLTEYGVNAADPVIAGEQVFISSGYGKGDALLNPIPGKEPELVWKNKVLRTQINGPILMEGYLYGSDGDSESKPALKCVDLATGTEKWSVAGASFGAITVADGKLIVLSTKGELSIAPVSPTGFKPVSRAQLLGGKCWTVPVLANGLIFCRNARGEIVCVDVRAQK